MAPVSRSARWPWRADSTLERSRRLLGMYRAALVEENPERAAALDAWATEHGQGWVAPSPWPYADDETITCEQVADLCHVEVRTVYHWHQYGLPYVDTVDGIRVRIRDLVEFQRLRRLARLKGV